MLVIQISIKTLTCSLPDTKNKTITNIFESKCNFLLILLFSHHQLQHPCFSWAEQWAGEACPSRVRKSGIFSHSVSAPSWDPSCWARGVPRPLPSVTSLRPANSRRRGVSASHQSFLASSRPLGRVGAWPCLGKPGRLGHSDGPPTLPFGLGNYVTFQIAVCSGCWGFWV